MIHSGKGTVTTAGTKVALASVRTAANWLIVSSAAANTGSIYIGDSSVANNTNGPQGVQIIKGTSQIFPETGGSSAIDLASVYADADNNGDKFSFVYGRK